MESIKLRNSIQFREYHFQWTIENYVHAIGNLGCFRSEDFILPETNEICFLAIDFDREYNKPGFNTLHKKVFIVVFESCKEFLHPKVVVSTTGKDDSKYILKKANFNFSYDNAYRTAKNLCLSFDLCDTSICKLVNDVDLVLSCDVKYFLDTRTTNYNAQNEIDTNKLLFDNLNSMYKNQQLCDIKFLIGEVTFKAHTLILGLVSPYFLAMFSHKNMIENTEKIVNLTEDSDITPEIFQSFLDYIYGSKTILELSNVVFELLALADKYNVEKLHKSCQKYLLSTICESNVAKILLLAQKYNCETLKEQALYFARKHLGAIKSSVEFDELCKDKSLMFELL